MLQLNKNDRHDLRTLALAFCHAQCQKGYKLSQKAVLYLLDLNITRKNINLYWHEVEPHHSLCIAGYDHALIRKQIGDLLHLWDYSCAKASEYIIKYYQKGKTFYPIDEAFINESYRLFINQDKISGCQPLTIDITYQHFDKLLHWLIDCKFTSQITSETE